jgi:hypothetical protein
VRIHKKYLHPPEQKTVLFLMDFQEKPLAHFMGKTIEVQHYHEEYKYDFYVHYPDKNKPYIRIIFYGGNFEK